MPAPHPTPAAAPLGRRAFSIAGALLVCVLALRPFYGALMYPGAHEWLVSCALILGGLTTAAVALGCGSPVPRVATAAMGTWVVWAFVSIAWSVDRGATVHASFELAGLACVWWAAAQVSGHARWRRAGAAALGLGLSLNCARALYQYFFLFEQVRRDTFGQMTEWIGNVAMDRMYSNRVFAWFVSPTVFGDYLAVLVPVVVAFALARWSAPRRGRALVLTLLSAVLACVAVWCLALTTARGAWLATAAALLVLVVWQTGRWVLQARAVAMVLLGVSLAYGLPLHAQDAAPAADAPADFVTGMDPAYFDGGLPELQQLLDSHTLRMRATYWRGTLHMVRDHPVLGLGWGTWGAAYPRYTVRGGWPTKLAHNNYLQVWAELGPVGLLCFVTFLGTALWGGVRHARLALTPAARWGWAGATCAVIAFSVHSLTDFALYTPSVAWIAFALFGALHGAPASPAPGRSAPHRLTALLAVVAVLALLAVWQRVADVARGVRDAHALVQDGQLVAALPTAMETMRAAPWHGEAAAVAGGLIVRGARQGIGPGWQAGLDAFARAAQQQPLSPWARESYADALWELGLRQRDRSLLEVALAQRRAAVANFPVRPDLHARLAQTARALGEDALADTHAAIALELGPDYHAPTER